MAEWRSLLLADMRHAHARVVDLVQEICREYKDPNSLATLTHGQVLNLLLGMQSLCVAIIRAEEMRIDHVKVKTEKIMNAESVYE